ncbi:PLDc N-terminal domain-containing protein [Chitinispirillales bacterium ANBcel5]|uniref:PLDc N-terminal domain-containing protein n=1 Tax=Cellulosispirillum alkaliphilum TaxID=3039283 RepID=UPI002A53BE7E|nr:PLDc N-terminal domain-containing protein [Chitinispirillales bacterium ANBcel5]
MKSVISKGEIKKHSTPIALLITAQLSLLLLAQISITKRSPFQIRGRKLWWRLISLINIIGPLVYFFFGRVQLEGRKDFL